MPNQFDVFPEPHLDKIENAVVDTLLADAAIAAFFEKRIRRAPTPILDPEVPKPYAFVKAPSIAVAFQMQSEGEVQSTVRIVTAFEERRPSLEPGENSVNALGQAVWTVLFNNFNLQVARYTNETLVDRILEFTTLETGRQAPGDRGEVDDEESIFYWVTFDIVYEWRVALSTGLPV